jgi:TIR domain
VIGRLHVKAVLDDALLPVGGGTDVESYYDVFVSYSHDPDNVAWVNEHVYQPLMALRKTDGQALRVFMDKSELTVGMLWFRKLAHSIQETAVFLPIYSRDYFQRGYCLWESEVAQRKLIKLLKPNETTAPDFAIFPLQKDGAQVPPPYDGLQMDNDPDKLIVSISSRFGLGNAVSH